MYYDYDVRLTTAAYKLTPICRISLRELLLYISELRFKVYWKGKQDWYTLSCGRVRGSQRSVGIVLRQGTRVTTCHISRYFCLAFCYVNCIRALINDL